MSSKAKDIVEQADAAYRAGHFAESETLYRKALDTQPGMGRVEGQVGLIALWRNDLDTAERYLKAARADGPWLTRYWPITAQIDHYLALAYARAGRVHEAAEALRKATGPLPFTPFKSLRVHAEQLALFDQASFYRIEGPDQTTVPFVITDPLPVVQVSVNGSAPVNFFIDTGGEGITLDRTFAEKVNAIIVGEYAGEYAGGKQGMTGLGKIEALRLGDLLVRNIPVTTLDLGPTSKRVCPGTPVSGIVGTGFLLRFLSSIDYPSGRLILRRHPETEDDVDKALDLDGREHVFRMWLVETHLIFVEGSVNGLQTMPMLIDTGLAGAAFMTSKDAFSAAGVEMDWSKAIIGAGGGGEVKGIPVHIDEITLGSGNGALRKQGLTGVATEQDNSLFNGAAGFKVGGLISHQFFRDHTLSFDFHSMRLIVQ